MTYATKAGSTQGVAEFIGTTLRDLAYDVTVKPIDARPNPSTYDAVIVGSAIRAGAWIPEAIAYVEAYRDVLMTRPLAYFTVCLTLEKDTPENRAIVTAYLTPLREVLPAGREGFFAGVMDLQKLAFPLRVMMKAMKSPVGDFRQWEEIRAWTHGLQPLLNGEAQASQL